MRLVSVKCLSGISIYEEDAWVEEYHLTQTFRKLEWVGRREDGAEGLMSVAWKPNTCGRVRRREGKREAGWDEEEGEEINRKTSPLTSWYDGWL